MKPRTPQTPSTPLGLKAKYKPFGPSHPAVRIPLVASMTFATIATLISGFVTVVGIIYLAKSTAMSNGGGESVGKWISSLFGGVGKLFFGCFSMAAGITFVACTAWLVTSWLRLRATRSAGAERSDREG
jgi:hypothetical protein